MASFNNATETCEEKLCPICQEKYRVARSIPTCGHGFCEECLLAFVSDLKKKDEVLSSFECPVCRKPHSVGDLEQITLEWVKSFPLYEESSEMESACNDKLPTEETNLKHCGLCVGSEIAIFAEKFCRDCKAYLCSDCLSSHDKFPALKSHRTLDKVDFGVCEAFTSTVSPYIKCLEHPNRDAELFCYEQEVLLCTLCTSTTHKICNQDVDISQMSDFSDKKIDDCKNRISKAIEHLNVLKATFDGNNKEVSDQLTKVVSDVECLKDKIIRSLSVIVDNALASRKTAKIETEDKHFADKQTCEKLISKFDSIRDLLEFASLHGSKAEIMTALKKADEKIEHLENEISDLDANFLVYEVEAEVVTALSKIAEELVPDKIPAVTLRQCSGKNGPRFDTTKCHPSQYTIDRAIQHQIWQAAACTPTLTGISYNIKSGTLLLSDNCENENCGNLCLYDPKRKLRMSYRTRCQCATFLNDHKIAVTVAVRSELAVIFIGLAMQVEKVIKTNQKPKSIVALKNGTVALSWAVPWAFSISDISGPAVENKVYFTQDSDGRTFQYFDYMAVDEKRHHVIQPCTVDKAVYCFDFAGRPVFKYTKDIKDPRGAAVDVTSGCVFVCDNRGDSIHQLTCAGDPVAVIKHATLRKPLAICFDRHTNELWVSNRHSDSADKILCYAKKCDQE